MAMHDQKRKILILIPRMGGGGAERFVSILANRLCGKYNIQIVTLVSNVSFYELDSRVKLRSACYELNRSSKIARLLSMAKNFLNSIVYIRKVIKDYAPDIVFPILPEMDIVTYLATIGLKTFKRVHSERNDPFVRSKGLQWLLVRIYRSADMLVCQSNTVEDYYSSVRNKTVIPNPVDLGRLPQPVKEGPIRRIVSVGRLSEQKNHMMLEKAFATICKDFPEVTVTVYGEGPERQRLEREAKTDHLENRFHLPGSTTDVFEKIGDAAIFAFPSNYEGFPNALLEAIAMGIPVVTTDFKTGVAQEIVNKDVGNIVPVGDTEAFANALKDLLEDNDRRRHIREQASGAAKAFATERIITKWEALFTMLQEDKQCQEQLEK